MALVRPSLPANTIMDALYDNAIVFEVFGGDRVIGYDAEIYNNETYEWVYTVSQSNIASNEVNIQANALKNGIVYRIRIHTFNEEGDYSDWSDTGLINCYTTPVCTIDNISIVGDKRVVPDQNFVFIGSYQQAEQVAMRKFQYFVYDSNKTIIQEFSPVIADRVESYNKLEQRVEGFENGKTYFIELRCTDANGLEVSSGLISFVAEYEVPRIRQIVDLENEKETASVKVSSAMIQIIFKLKDGAVPVYINEQELQLYTGSGENRTPIVAYVDEYLNVPTNFTLKIYGRNIPRSTSDKEDYFLTLVSADGLTKICMKEYDNRIHVYKITTPRHSGADIVGHYASDVIADYVPNESSVVVQINHVNGRIDVFAQVIGTVA